MPILPSPHLILLCDLPQPSVPHLWPLALGSLQCLGVRAPTSRSKKRCESPFPIFRASPCPWLDKMWCRGEACESNHGGSSSEGQTDDLGGCIYTNRYTCIERSWAGGLLAFCTRPSPPFHAGPHLGWKLHLHSLLLWLQLQQSQPGTLFTWITWTSQVSSSSLALSFLISKPPNYVPTWLPAWADVGRNPASQPAGHCEGAFVISVLLKRMDGFSSVRYLWHSWRGEGWCGEPASSNQRQDRDLSPGRA